MIAVLLFLGSLPAGAAPKEGRKVLAFYYTWYGTPQVTRNWRHWPEGDHDPTKTLPNGMPDTGSTDHPKALYDSNDPALIREHLRLAQEIGINAFISTWWGQGGYEDVAFAAALKEAERTPVKMTVYYQTTPQAGKAPGIVDRVAADLNYILDHYAGSPAFFRYNGRPTVFIYSHALKQISYAQWSAVVGKVRAKYAVNLIADADDPRMLAIFDGLHHYNAVAQVVGKMDMAEVYRKSVETSRLADKISCATVIPGYDDSNIGRTSPIRADRENGELYRRLWREAIKADPQMVLISSFNQWNEGSEIEPSREHGAMYADLTTRYARVFKQGGRASIPGIEANSARQIEVNSDGPSAVHVTRAASGALEIENLDGRAASLTVSGMKEQPAAFELGNGGKHLRSIPTSRDALGQILLTLPANSKCELWSASEFLASVRGGSSATEIHKAYARTTSSPLQIEKRMLLADASDVALGLQTHLSGDYPRPEGNAYNVFTGFPFKMNVTIKSEGKGTVEGGTVRLTAPEDWTVEPKEVTFLDRLRSGDSAEATFTVTPSSRTDEGLPIPVIAWIRYKADGVFIQTQNNCQLRAVPPFEFGSRFSRADRESAEFRVELRSSFRGLRIPTARAAVMPSAAVQVEGEGIAPNDKIPGEFVKALDFKNRAEVPFILRRSADEKPDLKTIRIRGYVGSDLWGLRVAYEGYCDLRAKNVAKGVTAIDAADGRSAPAKIGDQDCRRLAGATPDAPTYLYFDVDSRFVIGGTTYVTVEYLDEGRESFGIHYDSTDKKLRPDESACKVAPPVALTGTGQWKSHTFELPDAGFTGRESGGADLRIYALAKGQGLAIRRVIVSKLPPL